MNIRINRRRLSSAGGLLVFIVVVFVIYIGAVSVYNLLKWAKKVSDGQQIIRPGFTNSEEIIIPPDNPANITGMEFRDPHIWFEWADDVCAQPGCDPGAPTNGMAITIVLSASGALTLWVEQGCQGNEQTVTFTQLGVPVDQNGMPDNLSWSYGTIPSGTPESWELQRSTNLVDWETVLPFQMLRNATNRYYDYPQTPWAYYRAVK